ncbi:hypothetical protein BDV93DRAFT_332053 [Ceratobasidium sp. AG-I]|nr:hypothetical protein BDV93DRAFT_332053 [Ceratobasidium sp. AG-I]
MALSSSKSPAPTFLTLCVLFYEATATRLFLRRTMVLYFLERLLWCRSPFPTGSSKGAEALSPISLPPSMRLRS